MYRKPEKICNFSIKWENLKTEEELKEFITSYKKEINSKFQKLGLYLRKPQIEDIRIIEEFFKRIFPPDTITLEGPYVLYRIIMFGLSALLFNKNGNLVGCNICHVYNDSQKTLYGIRVGVDKTVAKHNIAALLITYTSLMGMERGAKIRRALLSPTNYASASNLLNHVGYICETFYPDLPGFGPRFGMVLPLTPGGLKNNRIDYEKIKKFVNKGSNGQDYVIIECENIESIFKIYNNTSFRVVAFLKAGIVSKENYLLALPKEELGIESYL